MATTPRTAYLTYTGTINWTSGTPFQGGLLLILVSPQGTDGTFWYLNKFEAQRIPARIYIPITDGVFDKNVSVFFNSDIQPPFTTYAPYYYDESGRRISPDLLTGDLITINASPFTMPAVTLIAQPPTTTPPVP